MAGADEAGSAGGDGFPALVARLATANGWRVHDSNPKRAIIRFDLPSGRTQTLYAIALGEVVELSVPSVLVFDTVDDVPRDLMAACLRRNARTKVGFWCLEQIDQKQALSFMWNVPVRQLDEELFGDLVRALVVGCDAFESEVVVDPAELDRELHDLLEDEAVGDDRDDDDGDEDDGDDDGPDGRW